MGVTVMTDATLWRVVSLAVGMLIVGFAAYKSKAKSSENQESSKSVQKEAYQTAVKASVIFSVLYMVIVLGAAAYM